MDKAVESRVEDTIDTSGESLGIRARRAGSLAHDGVPEDGPDPDRPGVIDTRTTPEGRPTDHSSSEEHVAHSKHSVASLTGPPTSSPSNVLSMRPLAHPGTAGVHVQPPSKDRQVVSAPSSSPAKVIPPYIPPHRAAAMASPPPPSVGASFGKAAGGDYYSIPSPKLEPIHELTEDGSRIGMHVHIETPLKDVYLQSMSALTSRRPTPYTTTLLRETRSNTSASSDSPSATFSSISTPGTKSRSSNESMFDSPLIAPLVHAGSPIRFRQRFGQAVTGPNLTFPPNPAAEHGRQSATLDARRPGALQIEAVLSPLRKQEAKIRDILWQSPARDEDEEPAEADILPPELEQLGEPTGYTNAFIESCMPAYTRHDPQVSQGTQPAIEVNKHFTTGPEYNQKIPTLVGPNSLPYARCPSGVDSFAFDLQAPRPYDIVMPTKSTINSTLLALPAPAKGNLDDGTKAQEAAGMVVGHLGDDQPSPSPAINVQSKANHLPPSGISTHNERARQRMERVKSATMRREQARIEEQGRKELARIVKRLNQEQDERHSRALGGHPSQGGFVCGDVSTGTIIGDDLLDWHYDADIGWTRQTSPQVRKHRSAGLQGTPSGRQLNSDAAPFLPRIGAASDGKSGLLEGIPLVQPSYTFPPHTHAVYSHNGYPQQRVERSQPLVMDEAAKSQNRLLHILQQRTQTQPTSSQASLESLLRQQSAMIAALQSTSSQLQGGVAPGSPLTSAPNLGVLSAIQTMMQTNQQLISMLQDTERVLASSGSPTYAWPLAMPPISPTFVEQPALRFPPGLEIPPKINQQQELDNGSAITQSALYRFPSKAIPIQKPTPKGERSSQMFLQRSVSDDPAVVHSYRRKSVTFEDQVHAAAHGDGFRSAATGKEGSLLPQTSSPPYVPPALRNGMRTTSKNQHALPPRPSFPDISTRLMGFVPHEESHMTTEAITNHGREASLNSAFPHCVKTQLSETLSTVTNSEAQYRRADRSSAPSPELFPEVLQQSVPLSAAKDSTATRKASKAPAAKSEHRKPRRALGEKSGNISTGSVSQDRRTAKNGKNPGVSKEHSRPPGSVAAPMTQKRTASTPERAKGPNDDLWSTFVHQMGGVIP